MGFFDSEFTAAQFLRPGDFVQGTIARPYDTRQATEFGTSKLKFMSNGAPWMMAVISLDNTNQRDPLDPKDTGARTLYVDKISMKIALQKALEAAGGGDLEPGGQIWVQYTHDTPSDKGNPNKEFTAQYRKPAGSLGVPAVANGAPPAGPSWAQQPQQTPPYIPAQPVAPDYWPQPAAAQQPAFPIPAAQPAPPPAFPAPVANGAPAFGPPATAATQPPSVPDGNQQIAAIRAMAASGMTAVQIATAIPAFTPEAVQAVLGIPA